MPRPALVDDGTGEIENGAFFKVALHAVLHFDNYEITGANKNPLHIDGNIDFKKLDKIVTDLRLYASAFQPVKSARSTKATVYGSVIADMDMAVNGPLDALKIRGNVGLLTGTEVTYVMQDSPFALQQHYMPVYSIA